MIYIVLFKLEKMMRGYGKNMRKYFIVQDIMGINEFYLNMQCILGNKGEVEDFWCCVNLVF